MPDTTPRARPTRLQILARTTKFSVFPQPANIETKAETIDQRIESLHAELKITPAEESAWKDVAQTMRDNADAMEKLASEKQAQSEKTMTAVEDLQTYGAFAQAHVDHLKKLTSVFETLYNAMPEQQKKVADEVFARSRHDDQSAPHAG
jgi:transcriptional regulator